jgi:HlyD family secretion protein
VHQPHSQPNAGPAAAKVIPGIKSSEGSPVDAMSQRLSSLKLQKSQHRADLSIPNVPGHWRRWLAAAALLLAIFFVGRFTTRGGWFGQGLSAGASGASGTAEVVAVTVLSNGNAGEAAMPPFSGYVVAESKIQIPAKVTGTVAELPIHEGSKVAAGELLVRLDPQPYESELKQAVASVDIAQAQLDELEKGSRIEDIEQLRANVESAEARRDSAKKDLSRSKSLKGTISDAELDKAEFSVREAEANLKQLTSALRMAENGARQEQIAAAAGEVERAKAGRERAQYMYDCTRIVSDIDGTVLQKFVEVGESIRVDPVTGSPTLCTVANLDKLLAEVDVQERDLERIAIGQACLVSPEAAPELVYEARVERRSPVVNRQRGVVQVKVRILNPDGKLMPDMSCKVTFLANSGTPIEGLQVPELAVNKQGVSPVIFVLDGDVARQRNVTLGKTHDKMIEIASGINAGEKVLLSRQPLVDGQSVHCRVQ